MHMLGLLQDIIALKPWCYVETLRYVGTPRQKEGGCIVLVPTGMGKERITACGNNPSLLVIIDKSCHVLRKSWPELAPCCSDEVFQARKVVRSAS